MSKRLRDAIGDAVARVIEINRHVVDIEPDFIAGQVMEMISFAYTLHNVGWYGCKQHVLQISREQLRGKYADPEKKAEDEDAQGVMFPTLQERYPRKRRRLADGSMSDPVYALRAYLTEEDRWDNIDRLDRVSTSVRRHRNRLEGETVELYGPRKQPAQEPELV